MLGEVDVGELELWSDEDSEGPTTPRADLGRGTGLEARTRVRHPRSTSKPDPWLNGGRLECRGRLSRACAGWRRRRR